MIRRRAAVAGIATKIGNPHFQAAYFRNGEALEKAAAIREPYFNVHDAVL
jgi:hypothetical protein